MLPDAHARTRLERALQHCVPLIGFLTHPQLSVGSAAHRTPALYTSTLSSINNLLGRH
jgi:hypothetical protein